MPRWRLPDAAPPQERDVRKATAKKAARILELALERGVVAGGGVAYLDCIPTLATCAAQCHDDDVRYGIELITHALKAPFLQIAKNYGKTHPLLLLEQAQREGAGYGYDVRNECIVPMLEAGIVDSHTIAAGVLAAAVSAAASAITTDVMILRSR